MPEKTFKIFLSSVRLLGLTANNDIVITDATYKLIIEGYSVFTICTSDKNKRFHPFALKIHNIDYHPKTLIADDAGAITLGFSSIHRLEKVTVFFLIG